MSAYELVLTPPALRSLAALSDKHAWAVVATMRGPLLDAPYRFGKPLHDELLGWRVARCGTYRILYWIDEASATVVVERIDHRADVYRPR